MDTVGEVRLFITTFLVLWTVCLYVIGRYVRWRYPSRW